MESSGLPVLLPQILPPHLPQHCLQAHLSTHLLYIYVPCHIPPHRCPLFFRLFLLYDLFVHVLPAVPFSSPAYTYTAYPLYSKPSPSAFCQIMRHVPEAVLQNLQVSLSTALFCSDEQQSYRTVHNLFDQKDSH